MGGVEGGAPHGGSCFLDMTARASEVHDGWQKRSLRVRVLKKQGEAGHTGCIPLQAESQGNATRAKWCHGAHSILKIHRVFSPVQSLPRTAAL